MPLPTENEMLQEIGEANLQIIQQVARGMNLSNAEVSVTFDDRIQPKEFTIRGILPPTR